ncbi:uncharacterized protein LOC117177388 isoform X2 [Belonocnema kinseyi]|uniref:uncharacterized protein LOC117177388 isoform X2 n=1 Tax=Belonocnema kinseyi TaxID=2817044 RepID=UPI00143D47DE|nr:uncharacterized protein LOC117177388 isoform X2 [Belonocnema kinseyi]
MADGPSVGDAATDLGNENRRVPRERHKRLLESVPGTARLFLSQEDKPSIEVLELQLKHQRYDAIDDKSRSISSSNQQVVLVDKDSSRFTASSSGDDYEEDADGDDEDEDGRSGGIASVNPSVTLVKVTSLTSPKSTSSDSVAKDADGPVVGFVEKTSERMLVREKDKTRKMGKGGCIKKIEKVITAVECGESRKMEKEEDEDEEAIKEKEGLSQGRLTTGRLQGSPFKGQIRSAEDTLVGPCGKKRCADRYDSSESSDRGRSIEGLEQLRIQ